MTMSASICASSGSMVARVGAARWYLAACAAFSKEEVITPAKPEIVRGSSELLPPDVWEPPVQDPPTEDEEPKEAPVKPDEDARGIIGLWFEGNVRARAYRKMGRA